MSGSVQGNVIALEGRPASRANSIRQIVAGAIGNALEWYDFAAYGYFAAIFGRNFFPSHDAIVSLAASFGAFAAAFLLRPIGGALFGHIGDRFGRKLALLTSVMLMMVATLAIGLLPTYAMIGPAAPLLLVGMRMLQGLAVGGEYGTSVVFLVERSDPRRRGLFGSIAAIGATAGTLLGSSVGAFVAGLMEPAALQEWGWRIPFLLSAVLGGVAILMRRTMTDAERPPARPTERLPIAEAFATQWKEMLRAVVVTAAYAVNFYLIFVYLVTFMQQVDGLSAQRALQVNTLSMLLLLLVATPCFGALSDRVGRKSVLAGASLASAVLAWPLLQLLAQPDAGSVQLGQCGYALLVAAYCGTVPALLAEMFEPRTRCTAVSISYNTGFALLGGTAPIVAVYLVSHERVDVGLAYYLIAAAVVSFIGALTLRDRTGQPLS